MLKVFEILDSWIAANNPTPERLALAKERADVCDTCEFKTEITNILMKSFINEEGLLPIFKCGVCGCPLSKLVFSPKPAEEVCLKNKWVK